MKPRLSYEGNDRGFQSLSSQTWASPRARQENHFSLGPLPLAGFGADEVILAGEEDDSALETWNSVSHRFGGSFRLPIRAQADELAEAISDSGTVIHLTMYGESWKKVAGQIPKDKPAVIVVGGTKVPAEVFSIANHNVSMVTNHTPK
ncbi:MAG: hypothetical protein CM1200mP21_08380 [Candidatus Poseidoniales archaeon]|nr:MAG: hypothetical protein CM1200mP21_08380 [Candidatus Poseidoniales archaeon]